MTHVVDASALLAALLDESGADRVDAVIDGAVMTTVNLAEVAGYYAKTGGDRAAISTLDAIALTADRSWAEFAAVLEVRIELIR